jgi:deoxycytidine triphosphate deaminase
MSDGERAYLTAITQALGGIMSSDSGILIGADIIAEIEKGNLVTGGSVERVRGCSYDLTVGTMFWEDKIHHGPEATVVVPPGGAIALLTAEEVSLPDNMFATAYAINDMSSKGFLVLNPGHVDPGFKGALTVKALNVRKVPMPLHYGDPIFTVIFQRLPSSTTSYKGATYSRQERERRFNTTTIETSPRTIFEMMPTDRNGPFPGRDEVNEMIRRHWLGWLTLGLSVITLIAALVAAWKAVYPSQVSSAPPISTTQQTESLPPSNKTATAGSSQARTEANMQPGAAAPSNSAKDAASHPDSFTHEPAK